MKIAGARVIDPVRSIDGIGDVLVGPDETVLDGAGLLVTPGFVDLHAHLREPGFSESETIVDGAHAALLGGFTTVCCMPNTDPPLDDASLVRDVIRRGAEAGAARILPIATV